MFDRPFSDSSALLRFPELRMRDVQTAVLRSALPFEQRLEAPGRAMFVFALEGDFLIDIERSTRSSVDAPQGTSAGFECGGASSWRAVRPGKGGAVALLVSSIPKQMGVLQRLDSGTIIVPRDAEPFATTIRLGAELQAWVHEHDSGQPNEDIIHRCAEIGLMELVRFARQKTALQTDIPVALAHDEALLRAWAAYFNDPRRRWTLQALADAAGLGRTTFAMRFRAVFGKPLRQTLIEIRLAKAEEMLTNTRAPLIEIAFRTGYHSEAAFTRAFSRRYGMPPGRYRASSSNDRAAASVDRGRSSATQRTKSLGPGDYATTNSLR